MWAKSGNNFKETHVRADIRNWVWTIPGCNELEQVPSLFNNRKKNEFLFWKTRSVYTRQSNLLKN